MNQSDEKKDCLLLLSGGKDSFLSACILIESGYKVHLVTYDNGCGLHIENVNYVTKLLTDRYGEDSISSLGIRSISGIWRSFFLPIYNMKPKDISCEYGEITYSQLNCLTCRTAMYVYTILLCKQYGISIIAEGARKDQGFAIELDGMISNYRELLSEYGIELLTPVHDLNSDWKLKNQLLMSNFTPKTLEPQCLIGVPLYGDKLDDDVVSGVDNFFKNGMLDTIKELLKVNENKWLDRKGNAYESL
jgi:hypothetical protein